MFPAATDQAVTAAAALVNVLLVGGGAALIRRGRRIGRSGPIAGGVALGLVLTALAAVGTLAALAPKFFYFALLGL